MGLIRFLLAISVVVAHITPTGFVSNFRGFGGPTSVEVFFFISGYYVALILNQRYKSSKTFFLNRALRLYPIYWVVCTLVLIRSCIFPNLRSELFGHPDQSLILTGFSNVTFFGSDWLMFLNFQHNSIHFGNFWDSDFPLWQMLLIPQAWSLGIEVTFYLFAPFLNRLRLKFLIILLSLLVIARLVAFYSGLDYDPWTYRFFPFELPLFLSGLVLYRLKEKIVVTGKISVRKSWAVVTLVYLAYPQIFDRISYGRFFGTTFLIFLVASIILLTENSKIDREIGEFSYPIYICHIFVISSISGLIDILTSEYPVLNLMKQPVPFVLVNIALTVICSLFLLKLVRPIEKIRDRVKSQS